MALSPLGSDSAVDLGGGSPVITFGPALQQGDIVVVMGGVAATQGTSPAGVTTTGYTQLAAQTSAPVGFDHNLWAGYKIMGATPDTSVTCNGGASSTGAGYVAFYFRGDDSTQPDATATVATGNSTNPNCPSITTVTDNAVVLAGAVSVLDTTITVPAGYSNLTQADAASTVSMTAAGCWKSVSPAGAEDPAAFGTWVTGRWVAVTVAIRPAILTAFVPYQPVYQSGPILAQ